MREAQSSPPAHRGARVIGTDAMRILLMSHEPSDGPERNQDNDDNPNINAHKSGPAAGSFPLIHTERQRKPRAQVPGLQAGKNTWREVSVSRYYPKAQGKARIAYAPRPAGGYDGPGLVTTRVGWTRRDQKKPPPRPAEGIPPRQDGACHNAPFPLSPMRDDGDDPKQKNAGF
jgi:hypothetical protein